MLEKPFEENRVADNGGRRAYGRVRGQIRQNIIREKHKSITQDYAVQKPEKDPARSVDQIQPRKLDRAVYQRGRYFQEDQRSDENGGERDKIRYPFGNIVNQFPRNVFVHV